MPVAILVRQILASAANDHLADFTVVGEEFFIAFDAVWLFLSQDVLLPIQGLFAVCAVVAFAHFDSNLLTEPV